MQREFKLKFSTVWKSYVVKFAETRFWKQKKYNFSKYEFYTIIILIFDGIS